MQRSKNSSLLLGLSWGQELQEIFATQPLRCLTDFLEQEYASHTIYPRKSDIFRAYHLTPYEKVRVIFIGQDPYHGEGQAHGLCFSVPQGVSYPPSLKNLLHELKDNLDISRPNGDLSSWAQQGIFLINTILTVRKGAPLSHQHLGWEFFFQKTIESLNRKKEPLLFVLLGAQAQKVEKMISNPIHQIFKAPHPSPLSAYRGFFGSGLFLAIEDFIKNSYQDQIQWDCV